MRTSEHTIRLHAPLKQACLMSESETLPPLKSDGESSRHSTSAKPSNRALSLASVSSSASNTVPVPSPVSPPAPQVDPEWLKRQTEDRQFLESLLGKVTHELKQMRLAAEERLHQWQIASVELATALATELLYREVQANEFQVEQTIRTIVDELGEESPATIYLNPADLRAMQQRLGDQPLFPDLENPPTLIPTETIARGDCKVQGRSGGELASEISERIALMREDLLEKLHART